MVIELTDDQLSAVIRGEPVRLDSIQTGSLVVLRAADYEELIEDARDQAALVSASSDALNRWCKENPF